MPIQIPQLDDRDFEQLFAEWALVYNLPRQLRGW